MATSLSKLRCASIGLSEKVQPPGWQKLRDLFLRTKLEIMPMLARLILFSGKIFFIDFTPEISKVLVFLLIFTLPILYFFMKLTILKKSQAKRYVFDNDFAVCYK